MTGTGVVVNTAPRWRSIVIATAIAGVATLPLATQGFGLWGYAFPLFGIGIPYVLQVHSTLTRAWWITFVAITPLSVVALALDWPFSGHVLWNVLFLAHSAAVVRSCAWFWIFVASLAHLLSFKALFQTTRDLAGAALSGALAIAIVAVLWKLGELRPPRVADPCDVGRP